MMTVLNLMLGKGRGGLEQVGIDYATALKLAGIRSLTVTSPGAWVEASLSAAGLVHESLINRGRLDPFAPHRLRRLASRAGAAVVICHGNRALWLALKALKGSLPIIAVAHNYSTRRFAQADGCFAITPDLAEHLKKTGARVFAIMPNAVHLPEKCEPRPFRHPPVIGSMGRHVGKKGFKTYLEALSLLQAQGVAFRAVLGGDGEDRALLGELIRRYGLQERVSLTGWVSDKTGFYTGVDLFILPSLEESFGLVLCEAMAHALPVVTSDAEGPRQIVHPGEDALQVPRGDPEALAEAITTLLNDPAYAARLAKAGCELIHGDYGMPSLAERLQTALVPYISSA